LYIAALQTTEFMSCVVFILFISFDINWHLKYINIETNEECKITMNTYVNCVFNWSTQDSFLIFGSVFIITSISHLAVNWFQKNSTKSVTHKGKRSESRMNRVRLYFNGGRQECYSETMLSEAGDTCISSVTILTLSAHTMESPSASIYSVCVTQ
jgi:hypothetical protein